MNHGFIKCWLVVIASGLLVIGLLVLVDLPQSSAARSSIPSQLTPSTLPLPYLSDPDVADAPYGATPMIDGRIDPGEHAGAQRLTFPAYGGNAEVFFKEDGANLYVAFDFPDQQTASSAAQVFMDTNHDRAANPQPDDFRFSITRPGAAMENRGTGAGWGSPSAPISWTAATTVTLSGWRAEFSIQYNKLGLTAGISKVIGLGLINAWTPGGDFYFPRPPACQFNLNVEV